jgi:RimJ/RimL family protein N-acetyltransferase
MMGELETERLLLRPLDPDDLVDLHRIHGDEALMQQLGYPGARTRAQTAESLDLMWNLARAQGFGMMATIEKSTGAFIGRCGYLVQPVEGVEELELAWLISRERQGRGFATEAAMALRDHAGRGLKRSRVVALIRAENLASARVATKLGMQPEREVAFRGQLADLWTMALPTVG